MLNFFQECYTLDALKAEYRRLVKLHHPDRGGDTETMKAVNNEYAEAFEILKDKHNSTADEYHQTTETPEEFIGIISKLMAIENDLEIELCGSWLWISGNTKPHKDELKAAGCYWSRNKGKWYWHHAEENRKCYRGKRTMDEIRTKYGSQIIDGAGERSGYRQIATA